MTLVTDIWRSFRSLPLWVQVWVVSILVPVNLVALFFLDQPKGGWVAVLAIGPMVLNGPIMLAERGFSRAMALPHVPVWTVLVVWLLFARPNGSAAYETWLWVLLSVNLVSLAFDYPDAIRWVKGDRAVAGRDTG